MPELIMVSTEADLWMTMGFLFARAFGKKLDQGVQASKGFKRLPGWLQNLTRRLLDFLHHWWMGLLLWFYAPPVALPTGFDQVFQYVGLGWFLDDLPDVPRRFRKYFACFMVK